MQKDFWAWHKIKEFLNRRTNAPFFYEREVWWCYLGANIGYEQDGKGSSFRRPVLVLKKFNKKTFLALPVTTKRKANPFHIPIHLEDGLFRMVNISQIRLIDSRRLIDKIGTISTEEHADIQKTVSELIAPKPFLSAPAHKEQGTRPKP